MWQFREIKAIEEPVFNNTLEKFYNLGIDGLVRENIQNSLDGKLSGLDEPVEVRIETGIINADIIPGIEEIKKHIIALCGENSYTEETIKHMKQAIKKSEINFITFEDSNTKGLVGAEHGENIQEGDTWGIYAYKKGVHFTEKNIEREKLRGGSHGVGKIACNAASDIHMMFFANCDKEEKQYIGGTIQLIEHQLNGINYRSSGYFTDIKHDKYYPFENNFKTIFEKKTRGLKIIIPYLRKQYQGEKCVIQAVCDNFFVAILQKKLVVHVNDLEINDLTIKNIIWDKNIYAEQNPEEMKNCFTPLYIETYLSQKPVNIEIKDKKNEYKFNLYLKHSENIKRARIAIVRGIGMKIEDRKVKGFVNSGFNGIMIPASSEEDIFLKSLENESHTSITYDHIKDEDIQKNAKRFINNIDRQLGEIFSRILEAENPADGKIDTSEVIYATERSVRKDLSNSVPTVQLTKGNQGSSKTLLKVKTNSRKKATKQKEKDRESKIKNIIRRVMKKDGESDERSRVRYSMHPEEVKRVVLEKKEILMFDFTNNEQYSNENKCDISMAVIDGMGKKYEKEFDVCMNYSDILDKGENKHCIVEKNIIKDVSIVDGKVQLEMKITGQFNNSLKFMYYVEV